jgi:predicted NBD/HSP70 family sugar kinase
LRQQRVELGLRSETIRRANLSAIVRELHYAGPLSRSELGARTGLTRSAIRILTGELVSAGLVHEQTGPAVGTPGRPSAIVQLRGASAAVLAVEITVDYLAVAVVGLGGEILAHKRVNRPREAFSVDHMTTELIGLVDDIDVRRNPPAPLIGIGVGIAGIVRREDAVVEIAPNLGWHDVPFGQTLSEALGMNLPLWLANEADLGALAEHRRGTAAGFDDVLYISGEVGVGGGMIIGGQQMAGAAGYGGEVGHIPLNPNGVACGCGSIGCWETEIGERALLERAGYAIDGGPQAIEALIRDARFGKERPLAALEHVGSWVGRGIAALTNVLNPSLVVLGGQFERVYPFIRESLLATFNELALRPSARIVSIVPGSLGLDAPLLGAAELAFEALLDNPIGLAESAGSREWRVVA